LLLYITNRVLAIARELYPNIEFNIILYYPGGLDANGRNYSYLTAAISLGNKERKYSTPATECNKLSCYLDYEKAFYKLLRKLVNELDRRDGLPPEKINLLVKLDG